MKLNFKKGLLEYWFSISVINKVIFWEFLTDYYINQLIPFIQYKLFQVQENLIFRRECYRNYGYLMEWVGVDSKIHCTYRKE